MRIRPIKGKNIILRPFDQSDITKWYRWFNNPNVIYYMDRCVSRNTPAKQLAYLKGMDKSKTDIQLAIVLKNNNELIGTIGLHQIDRRNRNADISILIGETKYWGKGLGKEIVCYLIKYAFDVIGLNKLTAGMAEDNKGSYNLFASLGFKKEGILRKQLFKRGNYINVIKQGLLREEFINYKKGKKHEIL